MTFKHIASPSAADDTDEEVRPPAVRRDLSRPLPAAVASLETRYRQELFAEVVPFWEQLVCADATAEAIYDNADSPSPVIPPDAPEVLADALWLFSWLHGRARAHARWRGYAGALVQVVLRDAHASEDATPVWSAEPGTWLSLADGLREYADAAMSAQCLALARRLTLRAAAQPPEVVRSPLERAGRVVLVGAELLRRGVDPEIQNAVDSAVEAIIGAHHNEETQLLEEEPRCPRAAPGVTVFGRSFDALWAVMRYARRRGAPLLTETCAALVRRHVDIGWDDVFGGLAHAMRVDGGDFVWSRERHSGAEAEAHSVGEYHYMKTGWALAALATAALEVLAWRRERWAVDAFGRAQAALDRHFPVSQFGARRYLVSADRRMSPASLQQALCLAGSPRRLVATLELLAQLRAVGRRTL